MVKFALIALFSIMPLVANAETCACRNSCVATRVACKSSVCRSHGGTDAGPNACTDVKNMNGYVAGLQACEKQETACWDKCGDC